MKIIILGIALLFSGFPLHAQTSPYFPEKGQWQSKSPSEVNLDQDTLQRAVEFALNNEYSGAKDLRRAILKGFEREPFHEILGPTKKRGGPAGLIVKDGFIVAKWGDPERVDMTFSVTKSYLSTIAGLAYDKGLIDDVNSKLDNYVWDGSFAGAHNSQIEWQHLLNQSSDWSGELFSIKDWADRPPREGGLDDWQRRVLNPPGTAMEYNDVRVNLLAYSLLHTWRTPLPQVLKKHVMDPIGASTTWRWFGYDHAWVNIDGIKMQSVTGGGHSGGGVFVSTLDQARFGLLFTRDGKWENQQVISSKWIDMATESSPAHQSYGYMWWINKGPRKWSEVDDESIFYAAGFGGNFVVVDQKNDLLIVTRWLEPNKIGQLVSIVKEAL
ncbi:serine hydrolase [Aliiglaciecola sp. M165]|uniref:serine hydrolase domain-containing protein n=1 Tax=Aliiglaciecola sp. M165 TaxID=2593649 RepID=UPI00117E3A63|nr:serine hydrolase [Aliiglaciecola sp. M165]TRY29394.1 serine hydrolase [Aliiglaciecola sp. M165]